MRTAALALVPLLSLSLAAAAEPPPRAEVVILPGTFTAWGISPDGSAVLGVDADVGGAAVWRDGRVAALDRDPDPVLPAIAFASSRRARVASDLGFFGVSIWENGRRIQLATDGQASDVSADGRVVVGFVEDPVYWRVAMRWVDQVADPIRGPIGFRADSADGVSADGNVIVGVGSFSGGSVTTFLWREDEVIELPGLPYRTEPFVNGSGGITQLGLSSDGSTAVNADIVGDPACRSDCGLVYEAWRWKDGRTEGLGARPGDRSSLAYGMSGNGEVVVGALGTETAGKTSFIWDRAHGLRVLPELLDDLGADFQGFVIEEAWGMSDDGRRIMGTAHPVDRPHASYSYLAILPPACADRIDNDGDGHVDHEDADCHGPGDPDEDR